MRPAPEGARPDVTVTAGPVPEAAIARAPLAGDCRLLGPGRAVIDGGDFRALIEDGARVTLDLGPAVGPGAARLLIGYGATSVLLHQRGGLPLHAAAAAREDGAVLLLGPAGAGKSTLAAALSAHGYALIGDDLIAVEDRGPHGAALHPAIRTVKLWPDSAEALAAGRMGESLDVEGLSKDVIALPPSREPPWPAPLRAIFALDWLHPLDAEPEADPLPRMEALALLRGAVHRPALARAMGRDAEILARLAAIVAATPCFRLKRPRSFAGLARTADAIAGCVGASAAREGAAHAAEPSDRPGGEADDRTDGGGIIGATAPSA